MVVFRIESVTVSILSAFDIAVMRKSKRQKVESGEMTFVCAIRYTCLFL